MKIAIQGHLTRGKEVIQILESLGGKTIFAGLGFDERYYYYINPNSIIKSSLITIKTKDEFILYTLEEFEREFPFKIGDEVTIVGLPDFPKIITKIVWDCDEILYSFEGLNNTWFGTKSLKKFEMKEERNITLTLDKAKEWYNKGGDLKQVALQAFTEKELNPLPRSWEEYNRRYGSCCFSTRYTNIPLKYDALLKLEQLRDCWRNGWVPNWSDRSEKWCIALCGNELSVSITTIIPRFLTFPTKEMAKEFLKCFRDLIEKAGDLI